MFIFVAANQNMKTDIRNTLKKLNLNKKDKQELIALLQKELSEKSTTERIVETCPNCTGTNFIKHGSFQNRTRYKCKDCKKTFTSLTGTSISWLKKTELWEDFITLTLEDKTLREIAKDLNLSTKTVLQWRHRTFNALNNIFSKSFVGITETDDLHTKFNQKGIKRTIRKNGKKLPNPKFIQLGKRKRGDSDHSVKVLVMLDRKKTIDMKIAKRGRISTKDIKRVIDINRINETVCIVSDKHPSIIKACRDLEIENISFLAQDHVVKHAHVQNLNNLIARFKKWIYTNFNNVSTKYLQNYLNMFMLQNIIKNDDDKLTSMLEFISTDDTTYLKYKTSEDRYSQFLKF